MSGISALIKETSQRPLTLSATRGDSEKTQSVNQEGFQDGVVVKNLPARVGTARDMGLIPGVGRSPGGGNGYPLQYSCLEDSMDRRARQATVQATTKQLRTLNIYSYKHVNICVCAYIHMYVYIYIYIYNFYMYICMCICMYIYKFFSCLKGCQFKYLPECQKRN